MKRAFFVVLILGFFFSLFGVRVSAAEEEDILRDFSEIIPSQSGISVDDELVSEVGFDAILSRMLSALGEEWGDVSAFFLVLMGFSIIMALCEGTYVTDMPVLRKNSSAAVALIASVSIFSCLYGVICEVRDGILLITDFFSSALPVLTLINSSSGAVATASVQAVNINITLSLLENFCAEALLPFVFALFSLAMVSSFSDGAMASVARGVKSVFMWGIGVICTVLAAAIGLQSLVASAADNAALRAARYAASGTIPIVGSTVASALATLAGGLAFVKSSVGAASVAVVLSLAILPLVSLLLYRLAFSVAVIFLDFVGSDGGVRCFSAFRAALDALLAVYAVSVLICIIELVVFIKSGVSV